MSGQASGLKRLMAKAKTIPVPRLSLAHVRLHLQFINYHICICQRSISISQISLLYLQTQSSACSGSADSYSFCYDSVEGLDQPDLVVRSANMTS